MTEPSAFALSVAGLATGLACLIGLPLAWLLGRHAFRGKSPLQALLLLPLVLPATLLGYCVVLLGQQPVVARGLALVGLVPAFDWRMGVLIATTGALAMFVRSAQAEFARVDRRLEQAARTLGRSEWSLFWAVTLPLAWRGVAAGVGLAFARAVGEVALTLLVARVAPTPSQAGTVGLVALTCAVLLLLSTARLTRAVS
ncbi:MAG: ABC transporter permease subunit [Gemmatimonadetes bacterium]|nr:ABC transporter permease subunit [Gemmatimonadota bacterium]